MFDEEVSEATKEIFRGWIGTNCGRAEVRLAFLQDQRATIEVFSQWMGDKAPLELVLDCVHEKLGTHSGILELVGARTPRVGEGLEVSLPPSDGPITLEYVRIPPQEVKYAGSDAMDASGTWNSSFSLVLWVHRDACWDDGTELEPEEYDPPPSTFQPVVQALGWLEKPWKLALVEDGAAEEE